MKTPFSVIVALVLFATVQFFGARALSAEETNPRADLVKEAEEVIALLNGHEGKQFCWGPFLQTDDTRGKVKITAPGELSFELTIPGANLEGFVTFKINTAEKQFPLQYFLIQEKKRGQITTEIIVRVILGIVSATSSGKEVGKDKVARMYEELPNMAIGFLVTAKPLLALPNAPFQVPCP